MFLPSMNPLWRKPSRRSAYSSGKSAGTLRLGGTNTSMGWVIASGTTVEVTGGLFSGWNANTVNGTLRTTVSGPLQGQSPLNGTGLFDINGTTQNIATLSGSLSVTNSTSTGSATLNITQTASTAAPYTGVISDGTGKLSLAFTGTTAQGSGFATTTSSATQFLTGANTYTGGTILNAGTLSVGSDGNLGTGTGGLTFNGGSLRATGSFTTGTMQITLPYSIALLRNSRGSSTYSNTPLHTTKSYRLCSCG